MTTKFYHDRRNVGKSAKAPVKISLSVGGRTAYISTGIEVLSDQWDKKAEKIINHPLKSQLNTLLSRKKLEADTALESLRVSGKLYGLTVTQIRSLLLDYLDPTKDTSLLMPMLDSFARRKGVSETTNTLYELTAKKLRDYCDNAEVLRYEDITQQWLANFDAWMTDNGMPKKNGRNVYFRNLRTVFNAAIDDGLTTCYPFRKFKLRPEPTKSRAIDIVTLRRIFSADTGPKGKPYLDMFRLSFCLGGLSFCDLAALKKSDVVGGRVEFRRRKTGQMVSVAIQPEAQAIIDRYAGDEYLVNIVEQHPDLKGFLRRMSIHLRRVGKTYDKPRHKWVGDSLLPQVSQYWARYSVATIAAELGFGEDAIGALLGHHTNSVTSIYVRANRNRQVDELLRAVLDAVYKENPGGRPGL